MSPRIFIFLYVLLHISMVDAQSWLWAKQAGGIPNEEGRSVTTDPAGNVVSTGYFRATTINFGGISLNNYNTNASADVFVAKYDSAGNVLWAVAFGGNNNDVGRSVACDYAGNIYVTGYFRSNALHYESDSLINTSNRFADIFVIKLDPSGTVVWARKAGGIVNDFSNGICFDHSGHIGITGYFNSDTVRIDTSTLINNRPGTYDVLLFRMDLSGNYSWAVSAGDSINDEGHSISADQNGNLIITGYFDSPFLQFGSNVLMNTSPGTDDVFIAAYNSSGLIKWSKRAGGNADDRGFGIASDQSGNDYITGRYGSASVSFDTYTLNNFANNGTADIFLVKVDSSGNTLWASTFGGALDDLGEGICTDRNAVVYITGRFSSDQVTFGPTTLTNIFTGSSDIFIATFDSSGTAKWSVRAGRTYNDYGQSISVFDTNYVFITGYFRDPFIDLGSFVLSNGGPGNEDYFIAELGPPEPLPIELLEFSGRSEKNNVHLNWTTASEINNEYFSIERGLSPDHFEETGRLSGNGNSSCLKKYSYLDPSLYNGTWYYRLKQVDIDGLFTYSETIAVRVNDKNYLMVAPFNNPVRSGNLPLLINSTTASEIHLIISDNTGTVVRREMVTANPGDNRYDISVDDFSSGLYHLSIITPDGTTNVPFIIAE